MKKKASFFLPVMIIVLITAACGQNTNKQTDSQSDNENTETFLQDSVSVEETDKIEDVPPSTDRYIDGTYTGVAQGNKPGIHVTVIVESGRISQVKIDSHDETEGYTDEVMIEVPERIVARNSTDIDVVSGATYTVDGIKRAVDRALKDAKTD